MYPPSFISGLHHSLTRELLAFGSRLGRPWRSLGLALGLGCWAIVMALVMISGEALAAPGFVLCGEDCADATYYVGYGRSNHVDFRGAIAELPSQPRFIYPQVADFRTQESAPNVDQQQLELPEGPASAIHRIDDLRVGHLQKSETLSLPALPSKAMESQSQGRAKATSELLWGDTLHITSTRLPIGSPVALQIEREMGGAFVQPATDFVSYRIKSGTWVNGRLVPQLNYELARLPGPGEGDREQGQAKVAASVLVKVGDAVRLEGRLLVEDGVVASETPQLLDGIDSVNYRVELLSDDGCARSDSTRLTGGDCNG